MGIKQNLSHTMHFQHAVLSLSIPKGLKSFDPDEDRQFWGRNWQKLERYIDPQSQGLHRELIPLSEMASDELLWEAG